MICRPCTRPRRWPIEELRRGAGPYLLECMTYRMAGHYVGDSQQYRSKEELASIREKCPIERLKKRLLSQGVRSEELDTLGRARPHSSCNRL